MNGFALNPNAAQLVLCDERGNIPSGGELSAARGILVSVTGRAGVTRDLGEIQGLLDLISVDVGGCDGGLSHGNQHETIHSFNRPAQSGFTMVEVLVALVVLAIGLLGIAALYLNSLQSGRTAIYRTQAVNLAADLADRIRMNRTAQAAYGTLFADAEVAVPACDTTGGCSDADLASTDLSRLEGNGRPAAAEWPGTGRRDGPCRRRRTRQLRRHRALGRSRRSGAGHLPDRIRRHEDIDTKYTTGAEPRRADGGVVHRHFPARRRGHGVRKDPGPVPDQ